MAVYVTPTPGANWCVTVSTEPGCACGQAPCAIRTLKAQSYPDVTMPLAAPARFDARQGLAEAGLVAVLTASRRYGTEVQMAATGRARVCASGAAMPGVAAC